MDTQMNQLRGRIHSLLSNQPLRADLTSVERLYNTDEFGETQISERVRKQNPGKPYRPNESTLSLIRSAASPDFLWQFTRYLKYITPFEFGKKIEPLKVLMNEVLKEHLRFTNEQICRMLPETRETVLQAILQKFDAALDEKKNMFFDRGFLFWDEYPDQKLKHLIDFGFDAVELSKEDYQYLKKSFLACIQTMFVRAFEESHYREAKKFEITEEDEDNGLMLFYSRFLQRFRCPNQLCLRFGTAYFEELLEKPISLEVVSEYKALSFCVLKEKYVIPFSDEDILFDKHSSSLVSVYCLLEYTHLPSLKQLLTTDSLHSIVSYIVELFERYWDYQQNGSYSTVNKYSYEFLKRKLQEIYLHLDKTLVLFDDTSFN